MKGKKGGFNFRGSWAHFVGPVGYVTYIYHHLPSFTIIYHHLLSFTYMIYDLYITQHLPILYDIYPDM